MLPYSVRFAPGRFLDPTLLLLVALAIGLWLLRPSRALGRPRARARAGWALAWAAWAAMYVASMPVVANFLQHRVEVRGPALDRALRAADPARTALVVLAAGLRTFDPLTPPRERLDGASTARVLGAARIYEAHPFELVILSGAPPQLGAAMEDLITRLGVPRERVVVESASYSTRENAERSQAILRERGFETVVLATSATHLRRAVHEFERAGARVIPAAVEVIGPSRFFYDELLPSSSSLSRSNQMLHELLGYLKP
ncbi:MAG: YdcF family protein [Byssovorax sp.]